MGTADDPQLPVTVTSADGRPVVVEDISRIVPLWGNITEVIFELGLGDNVVGRDVATTFEEAADLPVVTRGHDVSAESVLSLHPTLVLANADTGPPEAIEQIRNVGVPVLVLENPQRVARHRGAHPRDRRGARRPDGRRPHRRRGRQRIIEEQAQHPARATTRPKVAFLYVRGPGRRVPDRRARAPVPTR